MTFLGLRWSSEFNSTSAFWEVMLSDRETPLKTIGNRLGVWNGMKVNRLMRPAGLCSELMGVQFKHHHPRTTNRTHPTRCGFVMAIEVFAYTSTSLALWHLDRDPCLSPTNWRVLHRSTWMQTCLCVRKTFFAISPEKWGPFPSMVWCSRHFGAWMVESESGGMYTEQT